MEVKRKRLTEDEMQAHWRTREPLDRIALDLRADHFQARLDVEKLSKLLRADAAESPDGIPCWCGDGEVNSYCWSSPYGRSLMCIERNKLLSEVGQ